MTCKCGAHWYATHTMCVSLTLLAHTMCHLRATHITVGYSKVDFFVICVHISALLFGPEHDLKRLPWLRTSCNVPRFARWGNGRDVRAAPAPVAGYIESAHAIIAAPAPVVEYIAPAPAEPAAPAPVVEHFAPAPLRTACDIGGVDRACSCSQHLRQW